MTARGRTRRSKPRPGLAALSLSLAMAARRCAEERVEVVRYAAAIDVAKGSGMVCTRVPGSGPDRKRQTVWQAEATYAAVVALMDHLRCQGIQRLVLESTSDYWRIWLRREAPCCIPGLAGRNLEDIPGSDGLLKIRKVKGTIACQETSGRADAYGRRAGKTRVTWLKLYCLNPNLQKG